MKKQIRKSIFETNSSSMHAITVTSKKLNISSPDWIQIEFVTGEFGWSHTIYCDMKDKASYLWTAIVHNFIKEYVPAKYGKGGKCIKEGYIVLDTKNPEYIKRRDAIRTALVNFGVEDDGWNIRFEEDFNPSYSEPSSGGYIDHCPELDFVDALVFNEDRLIRFLFNDASRITTWNDNEWYIDDEDTVDEALEKEYWDAENECFKDGYYEASDWKHFDIPKDTEWKYLKGN